MSSLKMATQKSEIKTYSQKEEEKKKKSPIKA